MSNHSGSCLLNNVLVLLEKYGFFEQLDQQKTEDFIDEILKIGRYEDCNNSEILEGIGARIGFCYCCQEMAGEFVGDICKNCDEDANSDQTSHQLQQTMSSTSDQTTLLGNSSITNPKTVGTELPTTSGRSRSPSRSGGH